MKELLRVVQGGKSLTETVQARYTEVARLGASCCSTGCNCGVPTELYSKEQFASLTPEAAAASAGCGNPVALAGIRPGETVLDLGSGGGIDCFLAAQAVGPRGRVIGVDMTPAMVALARENAQKLEARNVVFKLGRIEAIPEPSSTADMVMSNCVINLSERKDLVFAEVFRVLKPGGRMVVSDIVAERELPAAVRADPEQWAACVAGADLKSDYVARIRDAGFERVEVLSDAPSSCGDAQYGLRSITVRAYRPGS